MGRGQGSLETSYHAQDRHAQSYVVQYAHSAEAEHPALCLPKEIPSGLV